MMRPTAYAEAQDANHLYAKVLKQLMAQAPGPAPRGMATSEVLGASVRLADARRCLVTWPERKLNYHFAVAEWWWIATGREDVASIKPYCAEIAKFSDDGETFFGAYGPKWTSQAEYIVRALRSDPDTRQAVATIWRPNPPQTRDVPCTVAMQYLWRDDALHAIVTMRSWDAYLGLPYDVFNFSRLLALVAGEVGLPVGSLQVNASSLHLYERDRAKVQALLDTRRISFGTAVMHPGESPVFAPLPGLIPPRLAAAAMTKEIYCLADDAREIAFASYCQAMGHRFNTDREQSPPWDVLL